MHYMGSKKQIANEIVPIMLRSRKENQIFVDMFCGGCHIVQKVDGRRIANDNNKYLFAMWKGLLENRERFWIIPTPNDFKCVWQKEVVISLSIHKRHRRIEKLFTI